MKYLITLKLNINLSYYTIITISYFTSSVQKASK